MLDAELKETQFPLTWDNSMRTTGRQCYRKLYWFLRGYDFIGKPIYFTWGSAWHEILRYWYSEEHSWEVDDEDYWTHAKLALAKGQEFYDNEIADQDISGDNSRENLESIWTNYLQEHPNERWSQIEGGGEAGWEYPIINSDYSMGGSLDGIIKWPSYGFLVREDKTTGSYLTDGYVGQWSFSGQVSGYDWYLKQILGPDDVFGVLVNMITKKKPGPRSSWSTPRTARVLEKRSKLESQNFIDDFLYDIEDFKQAWLAWRWPRTPDVTNCSGGVGKAPCLFRPACLVDGDYRQLDPSQFQGIGVRSESWEPWRRKGDQL